MPAPFLAPFSVPLVGTFLARFRAPPISGSSSLLSLPSPPLPPPLAPPSLTPSPKIGVLVHLAVRAWALTLRELAFQEFLYRGPCVAPSVGTVYGSLVQRGVRVVLGVTPRRVVVLEGVGVPESFDLDEVVTEGTLVLW